MSRRSRASISRPQDPNNRVAYTEKSSQHRESSSADIADLPQQNMPVLPPNERADQACHRAASSVSACMLIALPAKLAGTWRFYFKVMNCTRLPSLGIIRRTVKGRQKEGRGSRGTMPDFRVEGIAQGERYCPNKGLTQACFKAVILKTRA